ncbi:MAG: FHA domain-containing protein [Acidimicrobiales bacterium]|nr:FHA domain-containing protein [Acidimicrobiales bacterium]
MTDQGSSDVPASDPGPPSEPTGMVPRVETRLADFLGGDPPLPAALLLVVGGSARGQIVAIESLPAIIGRSPDVDLTIDDDTVSRRHAEIRGSRSEIEIEDRGSSNGTTLNGNDIAGPITLHDGDLVGLGSATFLVKKIC